MSDNNNNNNNSNSDNSKIQKSICEHNIAFFTLN